jgi:RimK-like ATP-grasp domain
LSNSRDATADFFEERLRRSCCHYLRIDTETLGCADLSFSAQSAGWTGTFRAKDLPVDVDSIASVYFRRPEPPMPKSSIADQMRPWAASELRSAWGGVLAANPKIKWVNHPLAATGASYKPEQLTRASRFGLLIPDTLITTDPGAARAFCQSHHWHVVAKPVSHGEVRAPDDSVTGLIYTNALDARHEPLLDHVSACPTLLQQRIDKDVDVRVTIVDSECIAVALHSQELSTNTVDCRRNNMSGMRYSRIELPPALRDTLVRLTASYDLHYSAIDLVCDRAGNYWYLELNPSGQWAWLEQLLEAPISDAIIRCLTVG